MSRLAGRHPVVAVGSNAAPGQLARKFSAAGLDCAVPVLRAVASGLRVLPSAHLNRHGYVPSAPAFQSTSSARVFVTYLDDDQLIRLDETEPNYVRIRFPDVRLTDLDQPVGDSWIYRSRQGVITDERVLDSGHLPSQPALLTRLISLLPELAGAGVSSASNLVVAVRSGRLDPFWVTSLIQQGLATGQ